MPKYPSSRSSVPASVGRPDTLLDRANRAKLEGRRGEAIALWRRILSIDSLNVEAMIQLGTHLTEDGLFGEGIGFLDDSLRIDPARPVAWFLRGIALEKIGYFPAALKSYDRVIALRPNDPKGHCARANTLYNMGRFDESVSAYRTVASIAPPQTAIAIARAAALSACGDTAEALLEYDRAIAMNPSNASAHTHKAFVLLRLGELKRGFELYEWRHRIPEFIRSGPNFSGQPWSPEVSLAGKTLLLHHEQGLGDTVQFCRYATVAANAGARVILDVPETLAELMATVAGVSQIVIDGHSVPDFDLRCSLMSLPRVFGTTLETIPAEVPYLRADPHRVTVWRDRISHLDGRRVGLAWAGGSRLGDAVLVGIDQRRSLPLTTLAPPGSVAGCTFVSLQLGPPAAEAATPPAGMVLRDYTSELHNFADTAALIETLDLVISVDTSVAHVAAAMGKPVWLLNRFDTCWRWLLDRDDSPWYPTLRQFRQTTPGDWDDVVARVAGALREFAAA